MRHDTQQRQDETHDDEQYNTGRYEGYATRRYETQRREGTTLGNALRARLDTRNGTYATGRVSNVSTDICSSPPCLLRTSEKESEQQISVQVGGSLTSFTQTGLAAGQEYTVSMSGVMEGRRGAESTAQFMTLISGPTNLRVVKTTSTTAVVQWEHSQGEIDRYRLTVTPSDGEGRSEELTIPPGHESEQTATTQVTPGKTLPRVSMAALTIRVTQAPGQDVGDGHHEVNPLPEAKAFDQQKSREDGTPVQVQLEAKNEMLMTEELLLTLHPLKTENHHLQEKGKPSSFEETAPGGYMRRPNFGSLQNRTRPNSRRLPPPSRPLTPAPETRREQVSSTKFPATPSPLVSKESYPAE
ncbi:hypothetical protein KUCAC02_011651, partial [Chaenocephalus aceratus]